MQEHVGAVQQSLQATDGYRRNGFFILKNCVKRRSTPVIDGPMDAIRQPHVARNGQARHKRVDSVPDAAVAKNE